MLTGGAGRTGAARLAAQAALRIGAGAVTLGVPPAAQMEVASHITAVMLRRIPDGDALRSVLEDRRINAVCIGPGFGLTEGKRAILETTLQSRRACVLDADALTLLSQDQALIQHLHKACILTPHQGEFARLFPDLADRMKQHLSKTAAVSEAARRVGCTVLLKGADTVIASPGDKVSCHTAQGDRAAPWLATAGAGDVLAGLAAGLLARGFTPHDSACFAAFLHVECALSYGPGLIAEDLVGELPKVLRKLAF